MTTGDSSNPASSKEGNVTEPTKLVRLGEYLGSLPLASGLALIIGLIFTTALITDQIYQQILHAVIPGHPYLQEINAVLTIVSIGTPYSLVAFLLLRSSADSRDRFRKATILAEEANHAKSEFITMISHDIRTPLHGIIGTLDLIDTSKSKQELQNLLDAVSLSSKNLLLLVNQILELNQIEHGELNLHNEPFELIQTMRDFDNLNQPLAQNKGISLNLTLPDVSNRWLQGDVLRLQRILGNFIGNAIKFTSKGYVELAVKTDRVEDNKWKVTFTVVDSGRGIPAKALNGLFDKFTQVDQIDGRIQQGSGLGLAIAAGLSDRMGGQIDVESTLGKGTKFTFSLILSECEPQATDSRKITSNDSKLQILVAEDNAVNQMVIKEMLVSFGHGVRVVENGRDAVTAAREETFDLILMDINMPVMNGQEAARQIRETSSVPIIVITANAFQSDEARYLAEGFNGYLSKPFETEELRRIVSNTANR